MKVIGINVKTGSLQQGAPIHEIGLITFDTVAFCLENQVQLFPRILESECDLIDLESLFYSGVDLEEVMHVSRPSLVRCLEFILSYSQTLGDPKAIVYLGHNVQFALSQIFAAYARHQLPWTLPVPIFEEGNDLGRGYIDTSELIGLCSIEMKDRKLLTLSRAFQFDQIYTVEYLNGFFQGTYSLDNYFYQDGAWRKRSALLDLLRTCFVYQQIACQVKKIPDPGRGDFSI